MNRSQNCSLVQLVAIAVAKNVNPKVMETQWIGCSHMRLVSVRHFSWVNNSDCAFAHHLQQTIALHHGTPMVP